MFHHLYWKKFLPYIQSKSTVPSFKTITPCPDTTGLAKKLVPIFSAGPLFVLEGCYKVSRSLPFSRLSSSNSLSAFPHRRGVPALWSFLQPPLDPLQQLHVSPVLRDPELDAGLQVGSHQSRPEGQNPLPQPAGLRLVRTPFPPCGDTEMGGRIPATQCPLGLG